MKILKFLQQVDRRFLYVIVLFVVGLPFFMKIKLAVKVSPGTQKMYDRIESLHEGDFILFGADWGAGTRGENKGQTIALLEHVMRKKLHFAVLSFEPQSVTLMQLILEDLAKKHDYKEGIDFVNLAKKALIPH